LSYFSDPIKYRDFVTPGNRDRGYRDSANLIERKPSPGRVIKKIEGQSVGKKFAEIKK